jgi:hypothetical protein
MSAMSNSSPCKWRELENILRAFGLSRRKSLIVIATMKAFARRGEQGGLNGQAL